jgi:hypothetical protein
MCHSQGIFGDESCHRNSDLLFGRDVLTRRSDQATQVTVEIPTDRDFPGLP